MRAAHDRRARASPGRAGGAIPRESGRDIRRRHDHGARSGEPAAPRPTRRYRRPGEGPSVRGRVEEEPLNARLRSDCLRRLLQARSVRPRRLPRLPRQPGRFARADPRRLRVALQAVRERKRSTTNELRGPPLPSRPVCSWLIPSARDLQPPPITDRLGDVGRGDRVDAGKIGDRARELEHTVVGAR